MEEVTWRESPWAWQVGGCGMASGRESLDDNGLWGLSDPTNSGAMSWGEAVGGAGLGVPGAGPQGRGLCW